MYFVEMDTFLEEWLNPRNQLKPYYHIGACYFSFVLHNALESAEF